MKFSFDTITDFDKHIELSVPNYNHIFELISSLSTYYIQKYSTVYDLGCSTGLLIKNLSLINKVPDVSFIGYEISDNMRPKSGIEGWTWIQSDIVCEARLDCASLILSIFTLQFLPIQDRATVLKKAYDSLNPGGALIVCEKVVMEDGFSQEIFTFSYYDYKRKSFTEKEILDKQTDLRSIMKPLSVSDNERMFNNAGFTNIQTFFQSLQFYGWILTK